MDVTQAKTFLAIVEGGNFIEASRRIFVTQSTVSARIKALEEQLGKQLFIRSKGGCTLTPAGHQFHRFARSMVRVWEEARHQVAVPHGFEDTLIVGGQYSLWNRLLLRWVPEFQKRMPGVALKCEFGLPQRLMWDMNEGVMDMAVIYNPEHRPGLIVEKLMQDQLVLVTARPEIPIQNNYIFVDWGESYRATHAAAFPELHNPGLSLEIGALGINLLLNSGGSGYFPQRVVQAHIDKGLLHLVPDTPVFDYPAYVVYQEAFSTPHIISVALGTLREIADLSARGELPPPYWA
jgi:DNA-binding transcriptional LysR family regulator